MNPNFQDSFANLAAGLSADFVWPDPKSENWRQADLAGLLAESWKWQKNDSSPKLEIPAELADLPLVRVSNGKVVESPSWLTIRSIQEKPAARAISQLAAASGGLEIEISGRPEMPILLALDFDSTKPAAAIPSWLRLRFAENAKTEIIILARAESEASLLAISQLEFELSSSAQVAVSLLQLGSSPSRIWQGIAANLAARSELDFHAAAISTSWSRLEFSADLAGKSARLDLAGLQLAADSSSDFRFEIRHAAPETVSNQFFRGAAGESGRLVWVADAAVEPAAADAAAHQSAGFLELAKSAKIHAQPRLDIRTDRVAASHGCAIGRLQPQQLQFAASRGLPEPAARQLLAGAFLTESVNRIATRPARDFAARLVESRLAKLFP